MKTVLITGANRGIGLEFAKQYDAEGAEVIACCRHPEKAEALAALDVRVERLDVTHDESIARLAASLGDVPIDIVISNAGVYGPEEQSTERISPAAFLDTMRVNTLGPLRLAQALKPNLLAGREKKLALLTSKMGSISDSSGGFVAYRASKAALNMVAHTIALEWKKDGIMVALLHPGWVRTDMGGPGATLSPFDSVKGLRVRIAELSPKTNGHFVDYLGREIGW
ncbi:NAD(P)-dependent dehydrogenase (short-subunit alcohol dehydrogenase family) [Rhizomicrobium palustre]|uniref:NAD(P)-dependent dehydrogenase (Short-subunit alcohol dehydrogenase family) n=1 Tax=Rhizomicrobium palustre TaxID=189966 RepID=A0A846MWB6_9PROT|nr:SDR family oxidoreductase [Rhizomicrobium palustre]NIK87519.1 NAD(P)-dependent dehydrogenase (short-subunit alcohol dehydrogenase family) [Rhizomicrobium palustre]